MPSKAERPIIHSVKAKTRASILGRFILVFCSGIAMGCGVSSTSVKVNAQGILSDTYPIRGGRAEASANSIIKKAFALCKAAHATKEECCANVGGETKSVCEQEYPQ